MCLRLKLFLNIHHTINQYLALNLSNVSQVGSIEKFCGFLGQNSLRGRLGYLKKMNKEKQRPQAEKKILFYLGIKRLNFKENRNIVL